VTTQIKGVDGVNLVDPAKPPNPTKKGGLVRINGWSMNFKIKNSQKIEFQAKSDP
jgi:hypothetical protein